MNSGSMERASAFACKLMMTGLSLALSVAYGFLFNVFRSDISAPKPVAIEQKADAPVEEQWSYQEPES